MRRQKVQKKFNAWFWSFWILIIIIVIGAGSAVALSLAPAKALPQEVTQTKNSASSFDVVLNKEQINKLAQHYTKKLSRDDNKTVKFSIDDYANVYGQVEVLGQSIDVGMALIPTVTHNGNVALKAHAINVGQLQLPTSLVLGLFSRTYKTPDWVNIQPNKNEILLDLDRLKSIDGLNFKAKTIDMKHDNFVFEGQVR